MAQRNVISRVNRGISENQAQIGGIWEGMALQEKMISSLGEEWLKVNQEISKNQLDIEEISELFEGSALLENRTSSMAEKLVAVNQGMSKNRADIEELSDGMALQEDKTSSIVDEMFEMD